MVRSAAGTRFSICLSLTVIVSMLAFAVQAHAEGYGVKSFDGQVNGNPANCGNPADCPFTQAGGHPYSISTQLAFNTTEANPTIDPPFNKLWPAEPEKDVVVDLPPGLIGNPTAVKQCALAQLAAGGYAACPPASQVGVTDITFNLGATQVGFPVYNMVPPPNAPVQFGFNVAGTVVTLDGALRSGSDYGVTVNVHNISEGIAIIATNVTFWGVPSDPSHTPERACPGTVAPAQEPENPITCATDPTGVAFLRNPTSCEPVPGSPVTDGLVTSVLTDSWFHLGAVDANGRPVAGDPNWKEASFVSHLPEADPNPNAHVLPTACGKVPFTPTFTAAPTAPAQAGAPSGFAFDLKLPQSNDPTQIAEGDLRKAVVTLPAGVRVSPSSASGLEACSQAQIALSSTSDAACPEASKIGTLSVDTPLLEKPLTGAVYLATPYANKFGSLVALYLVAKGPGVVVKLAGDVQIDPGTGQLKATFDNTPQLPFDELHVALKGGPRAPLVTPQACGTYTTHAQLTSWSGAVVSSDSSFTLTQGVNGSSCAAPGFAPDFVAGVGGPVAGAFSPFELSFSRNDGEQEFSGLTETLPKGVSAILKGVPLCSETDAAAATCLSSSQIGTVTVGAGAGTDPYFLKGSIYLTGPYNGGPYGEAVEVPVIAGPFDLGTEVVRGSIRIDPQTAQATVVSDPFPRFVKSTGIPAEIRRVDVSLDRPGFTFNPTDCEEQHTTGTLTSVEGANAPVSSRFQVGECANLAFKPVFTVSTAGKTSKANGASLHVHLATGERPGGGEANIAKVDVQLPVVLPARLPTLQKACTAAQFAANPAGCPEGSFVGTATAHTPILANPLSGPAILVSHGGQAFPDLVLLLQGEGIRIDLTGHTQIKNGITYNHFETVPDAPVSSFDLTLPQGPHGVLTTDKPGVRNLCALTRTVLVTKRVTRRVNGHNRKVTVKARKAVVAPLLMPTKITAQNGAVINQNTKIAVTGCVAVKAKAKKKQGSAKKGGR
jgi:hypothetical protein